MVTTIVLDNTFFPSHNYLGVVRTLKIYSPTNAQVYNTVLLAIITTLYIGSLQHVNVLTGKCYSLIDKSPFPLLSAPSNHCYV